MQTRRVATSGVLCLWQCRGHLEPRSLGLTEGFFDVGGHGRHDFYSGVLTVL